MTGIGQNLFHLDRDRLKRNRMREYKKYETEEKCTGVPVYIYQTQNHNKTYTSFQGRNCRQIFGSFLEYFHDPSKSTAIMDRFTTFIGCRPYDGP